MSLGWRLRRSLTYYKLLYDVNYVLRWQRSNRDSRLRVFGVRFTRASIARGSPRAPRGVSFSRALSPTGDPRQRFRDAARGGLARHSAVGLLLVRRRSKRLRSEDT